jgi:endonuclease/exonuclease/phosphatase family metal-dependent hydrolase
MTLNVAHAAKKPVPPRLLGPERVGKNLDAITSALLDVRPDVVALQEIDRASPYTGGLDHFARLWRGSELDHAAHAAHGHSVRLGMRHGHALLARAALTDIEDRRFSRLFCHDKGWIVGAVPALGIEIDVASVHLEPFHAPVRRAQIDELVSGLAERRARTLRPLVVMGDMNTGRRGVARLVRGLDLRADPAHRPTFPAGLPLVRLDWILVSRELAIRSERTLSDVVSDHAGVVAELALS